MVFITAQKKLWAHFWLSDTFLRRLGDKIPLTGIKS